MLRSRRSIRSWRVRSLLIAAKRRLKTLTRAFLMSAATRQKNVLAFAARRIPPCVP